MFPIIIIALIAVLYIIINLFMITCIKAGGDEGIEQCSYQLSGVVINRPDDLLANQLYYRFSDNENTKNELISRVEDALNRVSLYSSPENISVEYGAFSIYPQLRMKISKNYNLSKLWSASLGRNENIAYSIHDECEFIRNLDLISEGIFSSYQDMKSQSKKVISSNGK